MDEMNKQIITGLQAYAMGIMAKDLSGRFPNPGKVIRNVTNITETVQQLQTGQANPLLQLLQGGLQMPVAPTAPTQVEAPKPQQDNSKLDAKEFYRFVKESKQVSNSILAKLDALAPPPAP